MKTKVKNKNYHKFCLVCSIDFWTDDIMQELCDDCKREAIN